MTVNAIYLFRGLAGMKFSAGLDTAAEKIIGATVLSFRDEKDAAEKIAADWDNDNSLKVRLAGHSMGATAALDIAAALATIGAPIEELVLLDLHLPRTLPRNVIRCVSVKQPHKIFIVKGFYHPTRPTGFSGDYRELDLDDVKTHEMLDDDPRVQELLIGRMTGNLGDGFIA